MFLSAVSQYRFSLVLDFRHRLVGKDLSACEEFENNGVVYDVNVSESCGAGSPGLTWIKGR